MSNTAQKGAACAQALRKLAPNLCKQAQTGRATWKKKLVRNLVALGMSFGAVVFCTCSLSAYANAGFSVDFQTNPAVEGSTGMLELLFLFVVLALIPSMLLLMTSFTRTIIVLSFMRNALGTQQSPPNQVLVGLALCLTLFIMAPVIETIQKTAYEPYKEGSLTQQEALDAAAIPIKQFMLRQTSLKSLNLFLEISKHEIGKVNEQTPMEEMEKLSLTILIPAFATSELEHAFWIGFLLYLPFLIIDMVVSSVLMSMGMVMLPPAMISLPFKILMFVLVDGWGLLLGTLAQGFR